MVEDESILKPDKIRYTLTLLSLQICNKQKDLSRAILADVALVFLSHSIKWRTKSKKKSPSGTLITKNKASGKFCLPQEIIYIKII